MDKTFDAATAEARIAAAWEAAGAFRAGANARPGADAFCIMIPPPNVTGSLHIGHAFNNTLQDILVRWHRMRGFDTLWQPGQDHAGIATQMVVERELAATGQPGRRELGREAFTAKVWEQKRKSGGTIIGQLKRLGCSLDWDRNAFTMSGAKDAPPGEEGNFHDAVIKVFVYLYTKGLIYRGKRLVNWDPHFETAISDLEVEQIEIDGHLWRLRYPLENGETYEHPTAFDEDGNPTEWETRDYLVVATTRPETMLGDTGVAVNPLDRRYGHLVGKTVRLPLVGRSIPIVADDYADPDKGTGAVKMTPAHDFNDWAVGQRQGLRAINVMTTRAAMWLKDNPDFAEGCDPAVLARVVEALDGADRYEARDWIIQTARKEGWLDGIDPDRHIVPHGDRSKVAIEPYLTEQWFVDAEKVVGPALEAVRDGRVQIIPESGEKTYFHWLENIEPWCISRQLWWGHQIPVWYGPKFDEDGRLVRRETEMFCGSNFDEAKTKALAHYQKLFPAIRDVVELDPTQKSSLTTDDLRAFAEILGRPDIVRPEWKETNLAWKVDADRKTIEIGRDPDVLDTWFSSGLWPIGTLGWPEPTEEMKRYFPTSVLVTGQDILFFWVARMMMMQLAVVNDIPFRQVYLHGLVRDAKGKKMSKSLGNVIDPLEIIDEYGADALRFTNAAMASLGGVLKLDTARIAGYRNFGTKLWNACRFAEMNGVWEGHATRAAPPAATATVNRWIIGETARVRGEVDAALAAHKFNDAAQALYAFVWGKVCDWYVEFAKPLFATDEAKETRKVMAWVLDQCMILLHPIMPFVTEELWGLTGSRSKMLVHADWPDYDDSLVDPEAEREMRWVIGLIEEIRSARAQMRVPVGLKLPMLRLDLDAAGAAAYDRNGALIERLARIDGLHPADAAPKGSIAVAVEGGSFALPLEGVIDIAAERGRLEKTLAKSDKDIAGLRGRLGNPRFVASAPEEVVEEAREQLATAEEEAARLRAALERLAAMG